MRETDLFIRADSDLSDLAFKSVFRHRGFLEAYIKMNPEFSSSFIPLAYDRFAPAIVQQMLNAGRSAGVGPMASVAGAISQKVGIDLLQHTKNVIIENGGDIFAAVEKEKKLHISVFAGYSPLSNKVSLKIKGSDTPVGVCTSSGTVGGSFSFGTADAITIISEDAALADAVATAACNVVKSKADIPKAIQIAQRTGGVKGVLAIKDDQMGVWGDIELE